MKIERHLIADIRASKYNPRVALEKDSREYKSIKQSIKDYGFVEPIVVNAETMCCIGGHQRLTVLQDMGKTEVDCVMVTVESPEKEKALCVALNKIKGEWDVEKLNAILSIPEVKPYEVGFGNIESMLDEKLAPAEEDNELEDEQDEGYDGDFEDNNDVDEDERDATTFVRIGAYRFRLTSDEYRQIISNIWSKGIYSDAEIREELKRKICND